MSSSSSSGIGVISSLCLCSAARLRVCLAFFFGVGSAVVKTKSVVGGKFGECGETFVFVLLSVRVPIGVFLVLSSKVLMYERTSVR